MPRIPPPLTTAARDEAIQSLRLYPAREAPEIYVDGGIRRGTDVVKALCLGAKAVGMGRPFVYALGWEAPGVEKAIESWCSRLCLKLRLLISFSSYLG